MIPKTICWEPSGPRPCLVKASVDVSSRTPKIKVKKGARNKQREARIAAVEIRAKTVTFRPPPRPDRKLPTVTLNVVLVEEPHPPEGQVPIQWILVTTLPINDVEQVQLIDNEIVETHFLIQFVPLFFSPPTPKVPEKGFSLTCAIHPPSPTRIVRRTHSSISLE